MIIICDTIIVWKYVPSYGHIRVIRVMVICVMCWIRWWWRVRNYSSSSVYILLGVSMWLCVINYIMCTIIDEVICESARLYISRFAWLDCKIELLLFKEEDSISSWDGWRSDHEDENYFKWEDLLVYVWSRNNSIQPSSIASLRLINDCALLLVALLVASSGVLEWTPSSWR